MKTGFQRSIKKSAGNRHPFYEMWGQFWVPFLTKKSVVCRSKMSLTCGPLKIVILTPSGHPKSIKFEMIVWCKFDRISDDGDKQCIKINALFLRSWCYFSSSAAAVLVGISKFKHIYEAELQLSTRFPFHCQDRFFSVFILESKFGQSLANMLQKKGLLWSIVGPMLSLFANRPLGPCMGPRCDLFVSLDVFCYPGGAIAGIDLKKAKQKATSIQIRNTPRTSMVWFGSHILHLRLAF